MRLEDKVAIITGAGSGIGEVTAHLFAREGAAVMVADINIEAAQKVAEAIQSEGGRAASVRADVTSEESAAAMTQATLTSFGRVDILFNNAGNEGFGSVVNTELDMWERIFAVHVRGAFLCSKYAISAMIEGGQGGAVINVSSVAGLVGIPNMAAYCAAKGAIVNLTRAMAVDFAAQKIRVNCIAPGTTMTPLGQRLIANDTPERLAQRLSRYPMGRFGQPDEIARSVLFLASDDSSYATGMCLTIDGGLTCV
ncbi:MAG: SDR family oxidoreductase [Anaerolineales bacterium]|nr:SDR family oxidoreductase [Anaerolineales bacterium]